PADVGAQHDQIAVFGGSGIHLRPIAELIVAIGIEPHANGGLCGDLARGRGRGRRAQSMKQQQCYQHTGLPSSATLTTARPALPVTPRRIRLFRRVTACTAACATNPATGAKQLSLVSESQEIQMGREYDREVTASIGLYPDSALQRYEQQFGSRLAATSERPGLPWSFHVVDDPVVNAFALPGGFIYVTRGILAHLNSEAELAGVVGHEIGHVTARHIASRMTKQQLAQVGLVVGSIASPQLERYAGLASSALNVLFLKYSRDDESQADHLGLRYMRRG